MPGPLLKNFGDMAEVATSVSRALQPRVESGNPNDGDFIEATIETTGTRVTHNLGRVPTGWAVIDIDQDTNVWRSGDKDSVSITLSAGAEATVTLWVF